MDYRNPSKKLTDFLSSYLEFDEEKLDFGIWSGDLSLRQVKIHKNAFQSILKPPKAVPADPNLSTFEDLHDLDISLVSGTIGELKLKIPWKNLVLGVASKVDIELTNVNILLKFENHAVSTGKWDASSILHNGAKLKSAKTEPVLSEEEHQQKVYDKQELIAQAERCLLDTVPLPLQDLPESEEPDPKSTSQQTSTKKKQTSKLRILLQKFVSYIATSIGFRLWKGLHVRIRNVRIGFVQDDVEFGIVINEINLNDDQSKIASIKTNNIGKISNVTNKYSIAKLIKIQDVGIFIRHFGLSRKSRKTKANEKTSRIQSLLSNPINPDDFIIQQFNCEAKIYLSPENNNEISGDRVKGLKEDKSLSKNSIPPVLHLQRNEIAHESDHDNETDKPHIPHKGSDEISSFPLKEILFHDDSSSKAHVEQVSETATCRGSITKNIEVTNKSSENKSSDNDQNTESFNTKNIHGKEALPQLVINIQINQIVSLLASQHFERIQDLIHGIGRLKEGKPKIRIRSLLPQVDSVSPQMKKYGKKIPLSLRRYASDHWSTNVPTIGIGTTEVVRSWWHYAFINVLFELRKTKRLANKFREDLSLSRFDWNKQKCHRKQYIDLYTQLRLKKHSGNNNQNEETDTTNGNSNGEMILSEIEFQLPVEQILLYRYLARSIHLGLKSQMADIIQKEQSGSLTFDQFRERNRQIPITNTIAQNYSWDIRKPIEEEIRHKSTNKNSFITDDNCNMTNHKEMLAKDVDSDFIHNEERLLNEQQNIDGIADEFFDSNSGENLIGFEDDPKYKKDSLGIISKDTTDVNSDQSSNVSFSFNISHFSLFICNQIELEGSTSNLQTNTAKENNLDTTEEKYSSELISAWTSTCGKSKLNTIDDSPMPMLDGIPSRIILNERHHEIILATFITGASILAKISSSSDSGKQVDFKIKGILVENNDMRLLSCGSIELMKQSNTKEISREERYQSCVDINCLPQFILKTGSGESNGCISLTYRKAKRSNTDLAGSPNQFIKSISIQLSHVSITISPVISDLLRFLNINPSQKADLSSHTKYNRLRVEVLDYLGQNEHALSFWDNLASKEIQVKNFQLNLPTDMQITKDSDHSKLVFSINEIFFTSKNEICSPMFEKSFFFNLRQAQELQDNVIELRGDIDYRRYRSIVSIRTTYFFITFAV